MIPLQLVLKNFLSYRDATLDFSGLHTACICGSNGAGKSSLLEAITWAIWGESRAASEDDVIHAGVNDARVDFTFQNQSVIYRIIRARTRGHGGSIEFQVQTPSGFIPLTERGMKATQQLIQHHLKLDYDTFVNSAYLRQGRADEFMLRKPNERKQILADLLKLSHYEELAEQAKDASKHHKAQAEQLEQNLLSIEQQLQQQDAIASQRATLETQLTELQQAQTADTEKLQSLQAIGHQRQTWEQQLTLHRQQYRNLSQDCDRLQQEIANNHRQQQELEALLAQEDQISAGLATYQKLQHQEESLSAKFEADTEIKYERGEIQKQLDKEITELNLQLRQAEGQLEEKRRSRSEIQHTLSRIPEVEAGLARLQQARTYLNYLDQLQVQVTPILQQRNSLQTQLDRVHTRLNARLDELRSSASQLQVQQQRQPRLQQAVIEVVGQLEQLEKKRVYQQRVQEKGLERRSFVERLQEKQREYEAKIGELTQKLQMLSEPGASCPLCDRPMDENHTHHVLEKTQAQQQEAEQQFWVVREQLTASERELQVLRHEYAQLSQELAPYNSLLEQRGQLVAQLEATGDVQTRLQQLAQEAQGIERSLSSNDYAIDVQAQLQLIEQQLQQLNYNEQTHALARGEVDRWRKAEIEQGKIKEASKRHAQIDAEIPALLEKISNLQRQIEELVSSSELAEEIAFLTQRITEIAYDRSQHDALKKSVREAKSWELRYEQLRQAQQQYPYVRQRSQDLAELLQTRQKELQAANVQIQAVIQQLERSPDAKREIQSLEQQIFLQRRQLDGMLAELGRLQQQQQYLESLQAQHSSLTTQRQTAQRQYRVYQELALAFGKNGIQAMMIENILPQLEAQTNSLLSRLSANQLHVQFVTQRAGRSGRSSKKAAKLIDTLDILIADARGTRPYETYSGGEAFRINFAIRLALARLLAQRAGTALQMLIVDEGFGTQDQEGCDRLVAAINAIASDFACILTVTHMPYFKEAFQARIEVYKTQNGSQLSLSI
jgi:exonuclease SbcC